MRRQVPHAQQSLFQVAQRPVFDREGFTCTVVQDYIPKK